MTPNDVLALIVEAWWENVTLSRADALRCSDALEEAGREEEAKLLRMPRPLLAVVTKEGGPWELVPWTTVPWQARQQVISFYVEAET